MKLSKIFSIAIIAVMLIAAVSNVALAFSPNDISVNPGTDNQSMKNMAGRIIGFIQVVGSVLAAVLLAILGIKYMMGSAEEKAEYKKSFVPYLVGIVLLFAATNIAGIIYNFATDVGGTK